VFGKNFISNPDLVFHIRENLALMLYERNLFYKRKEQNGNSKDLVVDGRHAWKTKCRALTTALVLTEIAVNYGNDRGEIRERLVSEYGSACLAGFGGNQLEIRRCGLIESPAVIARSMPKLINLNLKGKSAFGYVLFTSNIAKSLAGTTKSKLASRA
jgi:hypothetical protein